ncbi:nucleotidyltransferase domain-containing protein [Arachidicoccus soli]|uniref:Nucleotidyltransferase domain-containing protein n=1 Tax=Arachidicoccus soli TaxID=2341117 RepID=A0A386HT96_9BACT|nr:nucleotidyltransferase domain-containing protein [Arachidicoccus soli]AYD49157.1 nucleotidyltransferase domain-containing protein [Arachidicoccus soli]
MDNRVAQIAKEYKTNLQQIYGNELAELVLFGSHARGDYHEESDIDFAIVLHSPDTRASAELIKTSPLSSRLSIKYGVAISSLPVALHKKQTSMLGVYREIRKDGITI